MSKKEENLHEVVAAGKSRPLLKWLLLLLVLAGAGWAAYHFTRKDGATGDTPEYVTEPVKKGRIALIVTASGNLQPTNQVVVGSELSGTVQDVYADSNDAVKKGQPIAKLDTSKLDQQTERSRASLESAKARVSQAKATLQEAKAAYARQMDLHELSGGKTPSLATLETSQATVARAEADLDSANAAVNGAEAELRAIERDLGKAVIRSPVDGVVLERSIEVGQTVAASFTAPTLFTIAEDLRRMELVVAVAEADIGRVAIGQSATFTVDAWPGRTYNAKVKKVAYGSNNTKAQASGGSNNQTAATTGGIVTYATELEVANDDLSLRPGMTATVDIAIEAKDNILTVPNSALRFDPLTAAAVGKPRGDNRNLVQNLTPGPGRRWRNMMNPDLPRSESTGPRVFVLKDGKPVEIPVKTGITDGRRTEITGNSLTDGEPVIVSAKIASQE